MSKDKRKGQRLGQLVANALYRKYRYRWRDGVNTDEFHNYLFYISDEELVKAINDFLNDPKYSFVNPVEPTVEEEFSANRIAEEEKRIRKLQKRIDELATPTKENLSQEEAQSKRPG